MMLRTLRKRFMPPADDVVTLEHVVPVVPAVPIFRDRSNSSLMAEVDDVEVDDGDADASDAPPPLGRDCERVVCRTCRRGVAPASIAGLEAHSALACPGRDEAWAEAGYRVARDPALLAGARIQVGRHGPRCRVERASPEKRPRSRSAAWILERALASPAATASLPGCAEYARAALGRAYEATATVAVVGEDGVTETAVLALDGSALDGSAAGAAPFRFLDADESEALDAKLAASADALLAENAALRATARADAARVRTLEADLEHERLCDICIERSKDAACVPCGHLLCGECARKCRACPTCRRTIDSVLPIFR